MTIETAVLDIQIVDAGAVVIITPQTNAGRSWIDSNVSYEPWQAFGAGITVDQRYTLALIDAALNDGLTIGAID